jgi:ABC-type tungstate transport system permease subunit
MLRSVRLAPVVIAAALLLALPATAGADSGGSLTVVGTSDVSDSGLMTNVIQPAFQKAYPQFTFKYIGTATGTAITDAESGSVGASALIVHAASLENQFVSGGYSYEKYGRAIFINDFVLAGPTGDPAGVSAGGAHNIVQAFADIASAGIAGHATFFSRGGTPGTTVEEHQLWALVAKLSSPPAGLLLCAVGSASGGGDTPIASGQGVTANGQPCPNNGALPKGSALPGWYVASGLTQGPNVIAADACSGHTGCYVLTDRGTYDYLASGTDPAGAITGLKIVTRDDDPTAPGGQYALVNYFHAYAINPAKPGESVNLTAATDFLNLITSPQVQAQVAGYLAHTSDPGGAPFKPDASPLITFSGLPKVHKAGRPLTVKGTVANAQPGYPPPAQTRVTISQIIGNLPVPQASGTTDKNGRFSIRFVPDASGSYELSTGQVAQVENASLSPVFGDILSPAATTAVKVTVQSAVAGLTATSLGRRVLVVGAFAPAAADSRAKLTLMARRVGSKRFRTIATGRAAAGDGVFALTAALAPGRWQVKVGYRDPGAVRSSTSRTVPVTIGGAPAARVRTSKPRLNGGRLTLAGSLAPAAPAGATVRLLGLRNTAGAPARLGRLATVGIASGHAKFTLHAKLRRGSRWVLLVEYMVHGRLAGASPLRTVTVR